MPDRTPCPVCKTTPVATEARGDRLDVDCPRCGCFSVSGSTIASLPALVGKDQRKATLIGFVLRQMQVTNKRPLLISDAAQRIVEGGALPSVSAQADNLIRWLGANSSPGRLVAVSAETHGAILGVVDLPSLHLILHGLKGARLIEWHPTIGPKQSIHLTFSGMKRYEELSAAPQPPSSYPQTSHRHAAILSTDIVGYTSLMATDEEATLAARRICMATVRQAVERNGGRLVKTIGDGTLNEFGSAVAAMRTALDIHKEMALRNSGSDTRLELRMGLAVGDVVADGDDVLGDCVNLAARLQAEASPGTICTLEHVRDDIANKLDLSSQDLGPVELKGIKRPVRLVKINPQLS